MNWNKSDICWGVVLAGGLLIAAKPDSIAQRDRTPPSSNARATAAPVKPRPLSDAELPFALSTPARDIVKLSGAGVDQKVILAYIGNLSRVFSLTADDITFLQRQSIPPEVVTAMIEHDKSLRANEPKLPPITASARRR